MAVFFSVRKSIPPNRLYSYNAFYFAFLLLLYFQLKRVRFWSRREKANERSRCESQKVVCIVRLGWINLIRFDCCHPNFRYMYARRVCSLERARLVSSKEFDSVIVSFLFSPSLMFIAWVFNLVTLAASLRSCACVYFVCMFLKWKAEQLSKTEKIKTPNRTKPKTTTST